MRLLSIAAALARLLLTFATSHAEAPPANLALAATASTSFVSGHETILALNSGFDPQDSNDKRHGAYGNWPQKGTQWVEYVWSRPIHTGRIEVYWFDDHRGVRLPKACRLMYFDGQKFVPVSNTRGLGLKEHQYNTTTFDPVRTTRLRLEMDSSGESTGILQWRVIDAGDSPKFPPIVVAGPDRAVVLPGQDLAQRESPQRDWPGHKPALRWSMESGPVKVSFADPAAAETTATFASPGEYVLKLAAGAGDLRGEDTLRVFAVPPPPTEPPQPVTMSHYTLTSPLLRARLKQTIIHWIPHCYEQLSDPKLAEEGMDNFLQAGNKLAGRPFRRQHGAPWTNAYVHNTVESMCYALMYDPQGDAEIIAAQDAIRKKLADWIPKILAAQEPDGYLQTFYTLNGLKRWTNKGDHEGYTAGYFMESAVAHRLLTGKKDDAMLRAARRLADCWYEHIGPPPKKAWYDGHEELEQALIRLADTVDADEGQGTDRKYIELAKFLMDCRGGGTVPLGDEYDQSHLPVTRQYEAVGHAVRASYLYSGMAGYAMRTGDVDYQSAVLSLWQNLVSKKYYITGGIGSGETSEGFGPNYSLPNNAYCESCSNCGLLFFENKMSALFGSGGFADLYEDTYYNAILGDIDLEGRNFTYTNPLDGGGKRYPWHGCPCCVGNIPRTLLELPTWMYSTDAYALYVNMYAGSEVAVGEVAGTQVRMEQITDYPWKGRVEIVVHPAEAKRFAIHLRAPCRDLRPLYTTQPMVVADGRTPIMVNGEPVSPTYSNHYNIIARVWKDGDRIALDLPLAPQRIKADAKVAADRGRVALRYGPLIYCIESVDQDVRSGAAARCGVDDAVEAGLTWRRSGDLREVRQRQAALGGPLLRPCQP